MTPPKRRAPRPPVLECWACGSRLLAGEAYAIVIAPAIGFVLCRPTRSLDCLAALLMATPETGFAFRFLDPAAARELDEAESTPHASGNGWPN